MESGANAGLKRAKILFVTFCLETKSNQKIQGKPDRSARFASQRTGTLGMQTSTTY